MADHSIKTVPAGMPLPVDDPNRSLTVSSPNDPALPCVAQAGNIYTVLVSGAQHAEALGRSRGGFTTKLHADATRRGAHSPSC